MLSQAQCGLVQPALLRILAAVPDGVRGNNRRVTAKVGNLAGLETVDPTAAMPE